MRPPELLAVALVLAAGACATGPQTANPGNPSDRVLMVDANGNTMRQSTVGESATATFAAPRAQVWPAVMAAYADAGIEANFADQAAGVYGVRGLTFPKSLKGERIATFFNCGTTMTGLRVDESRVNSDILTTLAPLPDGGTRATFTVTGIARRTDGSSADPIVCNSSGKIEETLRAAIARRVGGSTAP